MMMKYMTISGLLAAAFSPFVSAQESANCLACKDASKSYCFYTAGSVPDASVVVGICTNAAVQEDCPVLDSLSQMYSSITASSDLKVTQFVLYEDSMDCDLSAADDDAVLLPMAALATEEVQAISVKDTCIEQYYGWCNYVPEGFTAGGYCGADPSVDCAVLANFGGSALSPDNSGKPFLPNPCADCVADRNEFCGYMTATDNIAYVVCLPEESRTTCPVLSSLDDMYISVGVQASDLESTLVTSESAVAACDPFENLDQNLLMTVTPTVTNAVITAATCEDCIAESAKWCSYEPIAATLSGNEVGGGYCGADTSCVTLADYESYSFEATGPTDTCSIMTTDQPTTTHSAANGCCSISKWSFMLSMTTILALLL